MATEKDGEKTTSDPPLWSMVRAAVVVAHETSAPKMAAVNARRMLQLGKYMSSCASLNTASTPELSALRFVVAITGTQLVTRESAAISFCTSLLVDLRQLCFASTLDEALPLAVRLMLRFFASAKPGKEITRPLSPAATAAGVDADISPTTPGNQWGRQDGTPRDALATKIWFGEPATKKQRKETARLIDAIRKLHAFSDHLMETVVQRVFAHFAVYLLTCFPVFKGAGEIRKIPSVDPAIVAEGWKPAMWPEKMLNRQAIMGLDAYMRTFDIPRDHWSMKLCAELHTYRKRRLSLQIPPDSDPARKKRRLTVSPPSSMLPMVQKLLARSELFGNIQSQYVRRVSALQRNFAMDVYTVHTANIDNLVLCAFNSHRFDLARVKMFFQMHEFLCLMYKSTETPLGGVVGQFCQEYIIQEGEPTAGWKVKKSVGGDATKDERAVAAIASPQTQKSPKILHLLLTPWHRALVKNSDPANLNIDFAISARWFTVVIENTDLQRQYLLFPTLFECIMRFISGLVIDSFFNIDAKSNCMRISPLQFGDGDFSYVEKKLTETTTAKLVCVIKELVEFFGTTDDMFKAWIIYAYHVVHSMQEWQLSLDDISDTSRTSFLLRVVETQCAILSMGKEMRVEWKS